MASVLKGGHKKPTVDKESAEVRDGAPGPRALRELPGQAASAPSSERSGRAGQRRAAAVSGGWWGARAGGRRLGAPPGPLVSDIDELVGWLG